MLSRGVEISFGCFVHSVASPDTTPTIFRAPHPPFVFSNPHLQFLPWMLQSHIHKNFFPVSYERYEKDVHVLDVYPTFKTRPGPLACVFILPGLRGHSQDIPQTTLVRRFAATGRFRCVVVHRRGHVRGKKLNKDGVFHLVGCADDLEHSIHFFRKTVGCRNVPSIYLVGVSVGSGLVCQAIGKWDKRRHSKHAQNIGYCPPKIAGGVCISPGYDISECCKRMIFPYDLIMRQSVINHFIRPNEETLRGCFGDIAVEETLSAPTLQRVQSTKRSENKQEKIKTFFKIAIFTLNFSETFYFFGNRC